MHVNIGIGTTSPTKETTSKPASEAASDAGLEVVKCAAQTITINAAQADVTTLDTFIDFSP